MIRAAAWRGVCPSPLTWLHYLAVRCRGWDCSCRHPRKPICPSNSQGNVDARQYRSRPGCRSRRPASRRLCFPAATPQWMEKAGLFITREHTQLLNFLVGLISESSLFERTLIHLSIGHIIDGNKQRDFIRRYLFTSGDNSWIVLWWTLFHWITYYPFNLWSNSLCNEINSLHNNTKEVEQIVKFIFH